MAEQSQAKGLNQFKISCKTQEISLRPQDNNLIALMSIYLLLL